jgi:hypothetical protein
MAYQCTLQEKRSFPVTIGSNLFYVEQYQLSGVRQFTEQTTVSGTTVFTNQAIRARRLYLDGRFLRTDPPSAILLQLDAYLVGNQRFVVELDGVRYAMCQLTRYTVKEDGSTATLSCRLECIVTSALTAAATTDTTAETRKLISGKELWDGTDCYHL